MPNDWIIAEVERLAALAYPDCAQIRAGGSTRHGWQMNGEGPGDMRGKKWVDGYSDAGRRTIARGDSYRQIRDDLEKLLRSRGIDPTVRRP